MRFSVLTLLFVLIVSTAFGQKGSNNIQLSDNITTESKSITGFDKIDVSEDFEVFVRFSDKAEEVKIEANENLHQLIQVEKVGETLKIYTKSYSVGMHGRNGADEKLVAYITAKHLSGIKGDEDVSFKLEDELKADDLMIYLNEDCTLEGDIDVANLMVKLDEDSSIDITGSAKKMKIDANEDCTIKSIDFVVGDLMVDLNEESEVVLTVNGEINLVAKEESTFHYRGDGEFVKKKLREDSEAKKL